MSTLCPPILSECFPDVAGAGYGPGWPLGNLRPSTFSRRIFVSLPVRVRRAPVAILSVLAVLAAGLVAAAPAQAVSATLVISQVYGGGGNANATYTHDYIEIFNRGTTDVSVDSFSLQYTSATGTGNFGNASNLVTELPDVTLRPGHYFLVQEATNAAVGATLPTADHVDLTPISMAAGAGKVALVTGDATLGCNGGSAPCDAASLARIVDLVGYGTGTSGANFSEGSPAPTISAILADLRKDHGCQDTDNNSADFEALTPAPRTMTTTRVPCSGPPPEDTAPSVISTNPVNGATNVPVDGNVTVTFSEPVDASSSSFSVECATTGMHASGLTGGPTTWVIDPNTDFPVNQSCTLNVIANQVTDLDTDDPPNTMAADYTATFNTVPPAPSCDDPQTHVISQVQGVGLTSPQAGNVVTVEAVVTAVRPALTGFFIQEEPTDQDENPATSEGVFVRTAAPPAGLAAGDVVQVTGGVREFTGSGGGRNSSQTQISDRVTALRCGTADVPAPVVLQLPVTEFTDFEHVEGMHVTMPQSLVISEYFAYGQFNETVVGIPPNGRARFDTPTAVQEPNTAATTALLDLYARSRVTVDDGRSTQNPSPPYFPGTVNTPFTLTNTFRGGDTLKDVTGVVEHTFGLYRVHPTADATYASLNPRPASPPAVGGDTKIASFNVLNYFLTIDDGIHDICSPGLNQECRGADTEQERERQRAKIIAAMVKIDADVFGLMEMENTPGVEPAADLAAGLNDATAPDTYSYIDTGVIGTDAIRLGLLYKTAKMTPVGAYKVLDSSVDPRFIDTRNRPTLAQTFQRAGSGERITVAVNH